MGEYKRLGYFLFPLIILDGWMNPLLSMYQFLQFIRDAGDFGDSDDE